MSHFTMHMPSYKAITFRITLEQSVLIGRIGAGDENSAHTFPYVPGSVLRGMLINQYHQQHGDFRIEENSASRDLFFNPTVARFLHAYPLTHKNERTLPRPLTWQMEKDNVAALDTASDVSKYKIYDWASLSPTLMDLKDPQVASPKPPTFPFCTVEHPDWDDEEDAYDDDESVVIAG